MAMPHSATFLGLLNKLKPSEKNERTISSTHKVISTSGAIEILAGLSDVERNDRRASTKGVSTFHESLSKNKPVTTQNKIIMVV
jgi:hypothetical protein